MAPETRPRRNFPPPIFILAPPRSHSTVTAALLGGHPDIYAFPELLTFTAASAGELLQEELRRPDVSVRWLEARRSGVIRCIAQVIFSGQDGPELDRARGWLREREDWSTERLLDQLLAAVAPKVGLEKSPDTLDSPERLQRCLDAYPTARLLHLTRHPVETQRSMYEHWRRIPESSRRRFAATSWFSGHLWALRTSEMPAYRHRFWRVNSEELLRDPQRRLPPILDWLDLPAGPEITSRMMRTENWLFAGSGAKGELYGGDPKFMADPVLRSPRRPGPISFDPAWRLGAEAVERMTYLGKILGY